MTSKDRVHHVLNRKKADRPATSLRCTPEVWESLIHHFDVSTPVDVLDRLDIDLRWVSIPFIGPKERSAATLSSEGTDFWGIGMKAAKNEYNTYYEIAYHPLAEASSVDEIYAYDWPSLDWWDYSKIKDTIKVHKKTDDRAIMFFAGGAFETPWYLRGMEQFLTDLYENPEIVTAICSKVREYYYGRAVRVLDAADGEIDIIGSGGDIGGQENLMLSPTLWREMIKPHTAGLIKPFKEMGLGTFYHSCGSVAQVIDDLAEIGVDLLDPIQVGAKGMEPESLFTHFGDKISFHGAIDEVDLLPHASPDQIFEETTRIMSILGGNGGYIVSPSHQVQGDTPVENLLAVYQAVKNFQY